MAQKRRRIFLVCDYQAQRAAEILFKPQGQQKVFSIGAKSGLPFAPGAGNGPAAAGWPPCEIHAIQNRKLRGAALEKDYAQFYGSFGKPNDDVPTLLTGDSQVIFVHFPDNPQEDFVRVLTPTEYERFMGLPDGWSQTGHDGKAISNNARYFALGNSIVVPCANYLMAEIKRTWEETR